MRNRNMRRSAAVLLLVLLCGIFAACSPPDLAGGDSGDLTWSGVPSDVSEGVSLSEEETGGLLSAYYDRINSDSAISEGRGMTDQMVEKTKTLLEQSPESLDQPAAAAAYLLSLVKCYRVVYNLYLQNGTQVQLSEAAADAATAYAALTDEEKAVYPVVTQETWRKIGQNYQLYGFEKSAGK